MLRIIQIGLLTLFWFCVGLTAANKPLKVSEVLISKLNVLQREFEKQTSDLIIKELQNLPNYTRPKTNYEDPANKRLPATCAEAVRAKGRSGIHKIQMNTGYKSEIQQPFFVYCEKDTTKDGDAWTIVQRRESNAVDFNRNWTDYKHGFGNLNGNFFIGLDKLYALTQSSMHELWVQLVDFKNTTRFAKYETFAIGSEAEAYALDILGKYSGDAGNSLESHQGYKFSTADVDNDISSINCAKMHFGGWWYHKCLSSNLNGLYLSTEIAKHKYAEGVDWSTWHGHYYSFKYVHMAIRSV